MSEKSPDEQAGQGKSQVNLADLINAKAFLARLHHISSHQLLNNYSTIEFHERKHLSVLMPASMIESVLRKFVSSEYLENK